MSDSPQRLPERPSIEQLHKQAKELLRAHRNGDAAALRRFGAARPDKAEAPSLADAQFVLAREYGFESWAKLKHHVEELQPTDVHRHLPVLGVQERSRELLRARGRPPADAGSGGRVPAGRSA